MKFLTLVCNNSELSSTLLMALKSRFLVLIFIVLYVYSSSGIRPIKHDLNVNDSYYSLAKSFQQVPKSSIKPPFGGQIL